MPKLTRRVRSLAAILENANILTGELGSYLWWRGHAVAGWRLVPGVYRYTLDRHLEWAATTEFLQRAPSRRRELPPRSDRGAWLYMMQHYRLPTRLLDWTESVLIAAFFACIDRPDSDATIWALNPNALNERQFGERGIAPADSPHVKELADPAFSMKAPDVDRVVAFLPDEVDGRMMLQQSAFTIHGKGRALTRSNKTARVLARLNISQTEKKGILRELNDIGIRRSSLFPDLENLALDMKQKWLDRASR